MKSLKSHLQENLQNSDFKQAYEKELRLARLAIEIAMRREKKGFTQAELATRAHITQQQISKVEHAGSSGFNVNTLIKVCDALELDLTLSPRKPTRVGSVRKKVVTISRKKARSKSISKKTGPSKNRTQKTSAKRPLVA